MRKIKWLNPMILSREKNAHIILQMDFKFDYVTFSIGGKRDKMYIIIFMVVPHRMKAINEIV